MFIYSFIFWANTYLRSTVFRHFILITFHYLCNHSNFMKQALLFQFYKIRKLKLRDVDLSKVIQVMKLERQELNLSLSDFKIFAFPTIYCSLELILMISKIPLKMYKEAKNNHMGYWYYFTKQLIISFALMWKDVLWFLVLVKHICWIQ